jgi:hypothetical protein
MSSITSSAYPVVTTSNDGDLFTIVRNGQLMKMNRAALQAFIETLAPDNFIALTDTPGTMVGQAGKVPAVNIAEDALEFVAGAANFFVSLTDGPGNFSSNALKVARVNAGETALEYVTQALTLLSDTPANYSGASEYVVRVNTAANAIEFVPLSTIVPTNATCGSFDIQHGASTQAYTSGSGFVKVLNDATGANTRSDLAPDGVSIVWDAVNSQFSFSQFSVGDNIEVRVDISLTTTAANQEALARLYFDNGGSTFSLQFGRAQFKSAGTYNYTLSRRFYLGADSVKNNPVEVQFSSDANATIDLNGYAVLCERRGA